MARFVIWQDLHSWSISRKGYEFFSAHKCRSRFLRWRKPAVKNEVFSRALCCSPLNKVKWRFEKENIATVPNLLSVSRIILSPVLGYLVVSNNYSAAFGLFAVLGMSDMVDGYIARNFKGQLSLLGSVLDPLADKCLISILCVTLTIVKLIPIPLAVIILGRDALLILASFYLRYITLPPPITWSRYWDIHRSTVQVTPTLLGKVSTFLQLGLMAISLSTPLFGLVGHPAVHMLWYLTGAVTLGSGIHYLYQMNGFKVLHKKPP